MELTWDSSFPSLLTLWSNFHTNSYLVILKRCPFGPAGLQARKQPRQQSTLARLFATRKRIHPNIFRETILSPLLDMSKVVWPATTNLRLITLEPSSHVRTWSTSLLDHKIFVIGKSVPSISVVVSLSDNCDKDECVWPSWRRRDIAIIALWVFLYFLSVGCRWMRALIRNSAFERDVYFLILLLFFMKVIMSDVMDQLWLRVRVYLMCSTDGRRRFSLLVCLFLWSRFILVLLRNHDRSNLLFLIFRSYSISKCYNGHFRWKSRIPYDIKEYFITEQHYTKWLFKFFAISLSVTMTGGSTRNIFVEVR